VHTTGYTAVRNILEVHVVETKRVKCSAYARAHCLAQHMFWLCPSSTGSEHARTTTRIRGIDESRLKNSMRVPSFDRVRLSISKIRVVASLAAALHGNPRARARHITTRVESATGALYLRTYLHYENGTANLLLIYC
jgi:hypothetical protein